MGRNPHKELKISKKHHLNPPGQSFGHNPDKLPQLSKFINSLAKQKQPNLPQRTILEFSDQTLISPKQQAEETRRDFLLVEVR